MEYFSNLRQKVIISIVLISIYLVWSHGVNPARQKTRAYTGTIEKVYQKRKLYSRKDYLLKDDKTHHYSFYWRIKTDTGRRIKADVPMRTWSRGAEGMRVVKHKGNRWPGFDYSDEIPHKRPVNTDAPVSVD